MFFQGYLRSRGLRQEAILLHANSEKCIFQKYAQILQNVILDLSWEEEIMTKDVWGAGERKM